MHVTEEIIEVHPKVVVLMGGLNMPDVLISPENGVRSHFQVRSEDGRSCYVDELFKEN